MTKTAVKTAEPAATGPGVVLFGLDENGKPQAARFGGEHSDLAAQAAGLMGLTVCPVTDNLADIAQQLPPGRIYANGRGFVPNVRRDLYGKLLEAAGVANNGGGSTGGDKSAGEASGTDTTAQSAAAEPLSPLVAQGYPRDWDDISVGHMVIAADNPAWFEAIVTATDGDMLTLRFRDYPKQASVVRHRATVALLKRDAG
jgi:hypothetical protein